MTFPRILFAVVSSLQVGCAVAIQNGSFPKWSAWLLIFGTMLQAFAASVWPSQAEKEALKDAAAKRSVPPLPVIFMGVWLSAYCIYAAGCAMFTPAIVSDIGRGAVCVIQHDGEPVLQIVQDCAEYGVRTAEDVAIILQASHASAAKSHRLCQDAGAQ